jgi:hypothetical protein
MYMGDNSYNPQMQYWAPEQNPPAVWGQQNVNQAYNQPQQYGSQPPSGGAPLFKTKLCRHFQSKGFCNMGDNCNFAHGMHEMRASEGGQNMPGPDYNYVPPHKPVEMYSNAADYSNSKYYKTVL